LALGLDGWARNTADGRVEVVAEGARQACEALVAELRAPGSPGRVSGVVERFSDARGVPAGFAER
jgi:acylphosphatase